MEYGPKRALAYGWPADHIGHGQNVLLDLGRESQHAHDLRDPGAGDAFPAAGTGSRVDVRSASRVGRSDLGKNAQRIRAFLARLAKR